MTITLNQLRHYYDRQIAALSESLWTSVWMAVIIACTDQLQSTRCYHRGTKERGWLLHSETQWTQLHTGQGHEEPCAFPVMLRLAKWRSEATADFVAPKPGSSAHQGNCQVKKITIEELSLVCASVSRRCIQSKRSQDKGVEEPVPPDIAVHSPPTWHPAAKGAP